MENLYSLPAAGAEFTKFCGGNLGGEHESCIEYAALPGTTDAFVLRDTKPEGRGQELRVTGDELRNFVVGTATQMGLSL
ncbi:DUF397 domain-containing protein [Streptomyces pathocidini]|uniref:DUF397 domain-containing protein n=1 Tax=Streptomyces pathocidini TaxID=1650571 RepID=A0ABW7UPR2_9ACTN|nr:DUF397 domain-containing protein [Streptomyces pathocidini]